MNGSRERLRKFFPNGLVFSRGEIADYEASRNPTGPRIDFDTAWEVFGDEAPKFMEEIIEYGSAVIRCEGNRIYNKLMQAVRSDSERSGP